MGETIAVFIVISTLWTVIVLFTNINLHLEIDDMMEDKSYSPFVMFKAIFKMMPDNTRKWAKYFMSFLSGIVVSILVSILIFISLRWMKIIFFEKEV